MGAVQIHLVDGTYELFRSYYGAPPAQARDGREVGAVRGLLASLGSLLREPGVTHVACAFDTVIESFRNELYPGYKTGEGIDPLLWAQFPLAERAVAALGVVVWSMVEFEADDALATGALRYAADHRVERVWICTPDKDLAQVVKGDRIVAFDRKKKQVLDEAGVHAKFGVGPASIPDLLALVGDEQDGIPGLPRWGGKSAAVVLDDAPLGFAVASTAMQIMTHAGQGCAITTRLVLPRSRHDEGVERLIETMASLTYGDPRDPAHLMGPLISERQRQRVLGYVATGLAEGATVALGGGVPAHLPVGYYVEPTVLTGVDPAATVAQEEIFGPVLVVLAHDGDDDAVRIANDSAYGLSGAVYSASDERAGAVARRVRTGTIGVNGGLFYGPDVPFGGYKQSGIGREMGVAGFEEYLETKAIAEGVR